MGIRIGGPAPWPVIVEGQTLFTVGAGGLVFTAAHLTLLQTLTGAPHTLTGVAVTPASETHTHTHLAFTASSISTFN